MAARIPGVAEVPMPPAAPKARKVKPAPVSTPSTPATGETPKTKAARRPRGSAPKPVRIEPNFGGSGMRIFVGESKIPVATISQETLDEAYADYGFAPTRLSDLESLLKLTETQRDDAEADRNVWEAAAKADRTEIVELADKLNRERQKLRDIEKLRGETIHERDATILGWRLAAVAMAIVAVVLAVWRAGR